MTDYSQQGEQQAILKALGRLASGMELPPCRFLDIGAFHPKTFSNTRALFEAGWKGVFVEPSPGPLLSLIGEYGGDADIAIVAAVVDSEARVIPMQITDDAVSTTDAAQFERWKDNAKWRGRMWVPTITLEQISAQFGHFDFWSIDAEGQSADLFLRAMALGYEPACICVEHDGRHGELINAAACRGYVCSFSNPANMIFERRA